MSRVVESLSEVDGRMGWQSGEVSAVSWQHWNIKIKDYIFQEVYLSLKLLISPKEVRTNTLTNAVWQGVACVVLPVGVGATS